MARRDHYLVALTTPKFGNDHFSLMVATKKEDGTPYYNVIMMGEPCEDCAESQHPWACTHKRHEIASWKDPIRMERWQRPYIEANRMTDLMQENFSIGGMKDNLVFNTTLVDALEKRPRIDIDRPIDAIYLAIDPAGGGPGSDMAITAMAQYQSRFVIVLLSSENLNGNSKQIFELVNSAITALRSNPYYRNAPIIAMPEGMSNDAWYWGDFIFKRCPNICTMCECGTDAHGRRYGVPKDKKNTAEMRMTFSMLLSMGLIAYAKDLIGISSSHAHVNRTADTLRSLQLQQLREHRQDSDSNKSRGPNDLAITAMMAPHWMNKFTQSGNPGYKSFQKNIGTLLDMWLPIDK